MSSIFHFKKHRNPSETGRSMVEILGVLAVLGVLAIGGIYGYKWAMDKHRANDIVSEVNTRATDIWHLYQDEEKILPNSPEMDAFPEYGELTQTSFPIMVTTHPNANAFKTWVDNVPSDVCKKVLNENLEDAITGLQFVHVENVNEDGTGSGLVRFRGDDTICGERNTLNQMVFTSFLDEGGGAVASPSDPNNPNKALERCSEDIDCESCCGTPFCDMTSLTCSTGCGDENPICWEGESGCQCVQCIDNADCSGFGRNFVCNPGTQSCEEIRACGENEYRSETGACIPC